MSKDLKDKTPAELEEIVTACGGKKYLAGSVFSFIHSKGVGDISQISPLGKAVRAELVQQGYFISKLALSRRLIDPDGTVKYTFDLSDGGVIESVVLLDGRRRTLCVSTQVGCAMNCVFCATGKLKLRRNLTAAEIVDQVYSAENDGTRITNVVFMGMGEPLANYDAALKSVRILNDPAGRNIGIRHLTVSTCGIAPAIRKLAGEDIHPRLAISLNATTDELRTKLMPVNAKYPIKALLDAVETYQFRAKERVTFEYVMIKDLNDSLEHAERLTKLLRRFKCNINLIEYNPHPGCKFKASGTDKIEQFREALSKAGIETTVRFKMGQTIFAACGQLGASCSK
ncbi:MAG: 23S rRNA (adenine(2503)-C(2))-methyltransferase RlmN [Sedimentisphaerales bacterium]|nr:23S rRNA (adenine(2503)-C(2))-methyltransferase RlmN [Sedimentisphaerales bacterium]